MLVESSVCAGRSLGLRRVRAEHTSVFQLQLVCPAEPFFPLAMHSPSVRAPGGFLWNRDEADFLCLKITAKHSDLS